MEKQTSHTHPNMSLYKIQQIALIAILILAVFASLMLLVVAVMLSAPLFIIMSVLVLLLAMPMLMALVNTPPVTIREEGLLLERFIGGNYLIAWDDIEAIEPYPLLPHAEQEILKQYLIGRKKYRAAEGIMLIVPSLPLPYRIAGILATAERKPVIALTNRAHSDYYELKDSIMHYASHAIRESLIEE